MDQLEGWKTLAVVFVGATITLLGNFGFDLTDKQQAAINDWLLAAWPIAMVIMRLRTRSPAGVHVPGISKPPPAEKPPTVGSPWWIGLVAIALVVLQLGGCANGGGPLGARDSIGQLGTGIGILATASRAMFRDCVLGADPGGVIEEKCLDDRDNRSVQLHQAYDALEAARGAVNAGDRAEACPNMRLAWQMVSVLAMVLKPYVAPESAAALETAVAGAITECPT